MGRLSTVDLLVLTRLDELTFILKIYFIFFTKQTTLKRRSTVLSFPLQSVFPAQTDEKRQSMRRKLSKPAFKTTQVKINGIVSFEQAPDMCDYIVILVLQFYIFQSSVSLEKMVSKPITLFFKFRS